jgi:hypothetical protein
MPRRLTTRMILAQVDALRDTLANAQGDLLAWRPACATRQGQALYLRGERQELVTFCPTLQALRALMALWEDMPYTMSTTTQWDGYLCTLTRHNA